MNKVAWSCLKCTHQQWELVGVVEGVQWPGGSFDWSPPQTNYTCVNVVQHIIIRFQMYIHVKGWAILAGPWAMHISNHKNAATLTNLFPILYSWVTVITAACISEQGYDYFPAFMIIYNYNVCTFAWPYLRKYQCTCIIC